MSLLAEVESGHMRRGSVIDAPHDLGAYRYDGAHPSRAGFVLTTALGTDGRSLFTANKTREELNDWWIRGGTLYPTVKAYAEARHAR